MPDTRPNNVKELHQATPDRRSPSVSGSVIGRYAECPSSYLRELEVDRFLTTQGIEGVTVGAAAIRGGMLHQILAEIPFYSEAYGIGHPIRVRAFVEKRAAELGLVLKPGDLWYVADSIRKRDLLMETVIERAGRIGVKLETVNLDAMRLASKDPSAPVSALPDVMVVVSRPNGRHGLVADYKTGRCGVESAVTNPQVRTLAALAHRISDMDSCVVAMLQRADAAPGVIDSALFDRSALTQAVAWVEGTARYLHALRGNYERNREPDGTPLEHMDAIIEDLAKPGHHCGHCGGAVACKKLRENHDLQVGASTRPDATPLAKELRARLKAATKETLPMKPETLSVALAWSGARLDENAMPAKVWEEAAELTRQLGAKGAEIPPGWKLKEGAKRFSLRETMPLLNDDGSVALDQATGLPMELPVEKTPSKVFSRLEPVLNGMDEATFLQRAGSVDATAVRNLLADIHGVRDDEVFERVLRPLGAANPVWLKPNEPSVIAAPAPVSAVDNSTSLPLGTAATEQAVSVALANEAPLPVVEVKKPKKAKPAV